MTNAVLNLTKALDFAPRKHIDHRRKGEREEPYINHLAEVARLLADATDGDDSPPGDSTTAVVDGSARSVSSWG